VTAPAGPPGLVGLLEAHARDRPDHPALHLPHRTGPRTTTYGQLVVRVDGVAAGLRAAGLAPGMRAALLVPPTEDFFALAFALLKLRVVPVLVDPGIGRDKVKGCLRSAKPDAFLGVPKAHLARRLLRWAPSARILVTTGRVAPFGGRTLHAVERRGARFEGPDPVQGAPAAIVFTSGSTGPPKGVEHGEEQLLAQCRLLAELYDLGPDDVSLATFPPFALFGPLLGMTTVVPRMEATRPAAVRPGNVVGAANRFGATVMFGSPALLDTVSRAGGQVPTLRRVISAGAPVPREVQRRTLAMLPDGAQVHTPYGATEALPVTTIGSDELLALPPGICVGRPVPGVDVAVVAMTDATLSELPAVLAPGEVGEIVVRGPVVSPRYADRPIATTEAKLDWGGRVGHRTGDVGWWDGEGRLWYAGRKVHVVHTERGPLFSVPCEEVFNACPGVRRTALVGVGPSGRSTPVLVVELDKGVAGSAGLVQQLRALGATDPQTAAVQTVLFHPGLPVDPRHNAKIDRSALAVWAAGQWSAP
jgi:acyl-CoA synthetase (AMP-forming)/AMP-acid ligase II